MAKIKSNTRRQFIKKSLSAAAVVALPSLISACQNKNSTTSSAKKSAETIHWKMVTTWPKNFPALGTGANLLAELITQISAGELNVKVYGAGELVPALGVFDAVSRGTAQMGHSAAYYWKGKHEAFQFFGAVPFGMNMNEMNAWVQYDQGQKLWDELCASFNIKPFSAGNTGVQMGGWYNKPINSVSDYKGLKIRMPGLGGDVLQKLGATVVLLAGGEIFQALKSGAIDATEWVGPYNDLAFGFHQAAKYYYWPGWHEPGSNIECIVNREAYLKLPPHLQACIKTACDAAHTHMISESIARSAQALEVLKNKHKVVLKRFPDPVLQKLKSTSHEVVLEVANRDPFTKKVYDSYMKFLKTSIPYNKITEEGYTLSRG